MEEKDSVAHIESANRSRLEGDLARFLSIVCDQQIHELRSPSLSDPASIARCTRAAQNLHTCLTGKLPKGVCMPLSRLKVAVSSTGFEKLDCYEQQRQQLNQIADTFTELLVAHLTTQFQNMVCSFAKGLKHV